jgi:hypothetical protein
LDLPEDFSDIFVVIPSKLDFLKLSFTFLSVLNFLFEIALADSFEVVTLYEFFEEDDAEDLDAPFVATVAP